MPSISNYTTIDNVIPASANLPGLVPELTVTPRITRGRRPSLPNLIPLEGTVPVAFTGCISEISVVTPPNRDYHQALRQYAAVYAAFQAHLAPLDPLAGHEFGATMDDHIDVQWPLSLEERALDISDEDVESLGYMGWLRS